MARLFFAAVLLFAAIPAYSYPQFLDMYRSDPFRNQSVDGCNTCHVSAQGGDARNPFGLAFIDAGLRITPMLRAQFPDRFVYPISRVGNEMTIHFTDPDKKQIVVESGGARNLVNVDAPGVNGTAAVNTTSPVTIVRPGGTAAPAAQSESNIPVDPYAREGAYFGSKIVNLPDGKPIRAGGVDFSIAHRFTQDLSAAGPGNLFGFDSSAAIAFGARVGLTDRVSVSAARSSLFKTISIESQFQLTRQNAEMPFTLQARAGVDGRRNFQEQYSPYIQAVVTRTFNDRVSVTAVPMFSFNTREELLAIPDFAFGIEHNNSIALGVGAGVRVLPTVSLVGEYIPRLWGFRGVQKDRPGASLGLQKSTFRHTFELLITRQQTMMPSQYAFQGVDTWRFGFNIYRRVR